MVSGKFSRSRDEMKELIEMHGGRNLAAVSANVDYIVAGDNMGPAKLRKAEKLGVKIISEEEFIAMVGGQEAPGGKRDGSRQRNNGKYRRQEQWRPGRDGRRGRRTRPTRRVVLSPAEKEYA